MIKKIVLIMFIPVFIMLYAASQNGNVMLASAGIILFMLMALSQIFIKG